MSAPASSERFQITVRVKPEDIDELEHVNNAIYLRWVQEAAVAHWRVVAPLELQTQMFWVVVRHEIDYKAPALQGDELLVETWLGAVTRITFERHTEIFRASDRQLLARARTLWCPIDSQTRKPKRLSAEVCAQFSTQD